MLADAFEFVLPGPEAFEAGAKYLLARDKLSAPGKLADGVLRLINS